jgi:O-antigen/teichoic acid export membrane protein
MALQLSQEVKLLAQHSAVYSLGNFMQRIVALLLLPVYTRFLTPFDYGIKELVGLSVDVMGILIATAISGAFFRFYFQYDSQEERNEVVSTAFLAVGGIGLVIVGVLALFTKQLAGMVLDDPSLSYYFLIAFAGLLFQVLNNLSYNYMKANKESVKFIAFSLVKMLLAIALNIYFVCFVRLGVLGILVSNLVTVMILAMLVTVPLIRKSGLRFSREKLLEMMRFGLPLIPSQLGGFVVHLSDRFFLKEYCSIVDVGLYSLGYRFGSLPGQFVSDPFNQIFQPRRLEVYKHANAEMIFGRIFTYFLMLMLFVGLLISVLTEDVLVIMADERFWQAYQIVPLIVLASILFSMHYHLNIGIYIVKKTKYLAVINLSNAVLVLALNFLLIPRFGMWGAAWATIIAFVYKDAMTYYLSSRFFKIHFEFTRIIKLFFVASLLYSLIGMISINGVYWDLIVKFMVCFVLYPIFLIIIKFFEKKEIDKIRIIIKNRKIESIF